MSRITFENYGLAAQKEANVTVVSGRYAVQQSAERLIVRDVAEKLNLQPDDRLLEIGCGPGNLLIPLSFEVAHATGIDHPEVCRRLRARFSDPRIDVIPTNFFDYEPKGEVYDKILIYSVVNTLADRDEAFRFIDKAVGLLKRGGRLLLGDIANADRKRRFLASEQGRAFQQEWERAMEAAQSRDGDASPIDYPHDADVFQPDDGFLLDCLGRYRSRGFHAYCLPQPAALPFDHTREDIIVECLL